MMTLNKIRIKSTIVFASVLLFAVSCSKDDDGVNSNAGDGDNNPGDKTSLVAKANLNFIDDGEAWELNCYKLDSYGELIMYGDTLFVLRLNDTDSHGKSKESAMLISIDSKTGIEKGTYTLSKAQSDSDAISFTLSRYRDDGIDGYLSRADVDGDSGTLIITSLTNQRVEGTFSFTAHSIGLSTKKLEVTNGVFHGDLVRQ